MTDNPSSCNLCLAGYGPAIRSIKVVFLCRVVPDPSSPSHVLVSGYAWSGGGRKILRVDLTGDGGKTWTQVLLHCFNLLHSLFPTPCSLLSILSLSFSALCPPLPIIRSLFYALCSPLPVLHPLSSTICHVLSVLCPHLPVLHSLSSALCPLLLVLRRSFLHSLSFASCPSLCVL